MDWSGRAISQGRGENITDSSTTGSDKFHIAQIYSQKRRRHWGEGLKQFLERLDLSDEQSSQIKAIYRRSYQANQESRQELQQAREEMGSLLTSEANSNLIRRKHREIQSLNQELGNSRFEAMVEVRKVLTLEQRREIADMMTEYRERQGYYRRSA